VLKKAAGSCGVRTYNQIISLNFRVLFLHDYDHDQMRRNKPVECGTTIMGPYSFSVVSLKVPRSTSINHSNYLLGNSNRPTSSSSQTPRMLFNFSNALTCLHLLLFTSILCTYATAKSLAEGPGSGDRQAARNDSLRGGGVHFEDDATLKADPATDVRICVLDHISCCCSHLELRALTQVRLLL
jgi:hypothetical protein